MTLSLKNWVPASEHEQYSLRLDYKYGAVSGLVMCAGERERVVRNYWSKYGHNTATTHTLQSAHSHLTQLGKEKIFYIK